ncbi:ADP-ribosylglycohydrolase family protein [Sulfurospirillum sp. 1612]|uniref:ADP-ribosylglycohydrolase family protein n=1 Tax=Sulfurospirillum sp. 1612 TaxID=3094835 RepID=UPI002F93D790
MFSKEKIDEIVTATLVADSYSLGAHWVYDEAQLHDLALDWEALNPPQALWHKGKVAGDQTHIGDQAFFLKEFLQDQSDFDADAYLTFWEKKMRAYQGYIDGATRETLQNLEAGKRIGSHSEDFSVIGRIAPLLYVSKDEEAFVENVKTFVTLSHNDAKVSEAAIFFARLLFDVARFKDIAIEKTMLDLKDEFSLFVLKSVEDGIASKDKDTFEVIREFGPACGIDDGFSGIVHLLCQYPDDLKNLLIQNAKAGGDSASRAMVAVMIIVAHRSSEGIPKDWFKINKI